MDGAGHQLLAGAVLAGDEDARVGGRHALHPLQQLPDGEALPHDLVAPLHLAAQADVLGEEAALVEGVAQHQEDAVGVERLLQEVVGAAARGLHGGLDGAVAADHHHQRGGVQLADAGERLQPVHPRHLHVHEREVGLELGVEGERLARARRGADLVVLVLQELGQDVPDPLLVVHHQDACHVSRRGSRDSGEPGAEGVRRPG